MTNQWLQQWLALIYPARYQIQQRGIQTDPHCTWSGQEDKVMAQQNMVWQDTATSHSVRMEVRV